MRDDDAHSAPGGGRQISGRKQLEWSWSSGDTMDTTGCKQKMLLAIGLGLAFVTLPLVILLVYGIAVGWNVLGLVIATVMMGLPAAFFSWLGLREPPDRPLKIDKTLERRVLQLAAAHDGELTASEFALGSQLRIDECRKVLEKFEAMNVARGHVGERGEIRYVFPELAESADDDDFMQRLEQEDPRSVLDFESAEREDVETVGVEQREDVEGS